MPSRTAARSLAGVAAAALCFGLAPAYASDVASAVVDTTSPTGTVSAPAGTSNLPVNITLTITGNQAGTATFDVHTRFVLSGGAFTASDPASFTVLPRVGGDPATVLTAAGTVSIAAGQAAGTFTLTAPAFNIQNSNDTGGKLAPGHVASYQVVVTQPTDNTPPVITPVITGTAGANDWHTSNVGLSWTVTDAQSAITSTTGCGPQSLTDETTGVTFTCSATSAGGTNAVSKTIKIDKTGPSAALAPSGTAGANGWFVSDVAVTTSGTDTVSGPVTCTAVQNLTAETAGQTVNGSCTNDAGLTTAATALNVKIDKTAPTNVASAVTSGTPGTNGWYTTDVVVTTTGTETVSGPLVCTGPVDVFGDTPGTNVTGSCTNQAGLKTDAAALTVKVDETNPSATLSASGTLGSGGWYTSDVTVTTTGADDDSNIASCTGPQVLDTDTGASGQAFNGSCTNGAGLTQNADPLTVKRDASAPSATLVVTNSPSTGTNGWYTSAVVVEVQGTDAQSGVTCTGGGTVSADTTGVTLTGSCTNGAGVTTQATSLTIKLDTTAPSAGLAVTAGTEGANGWYTSDVTVTTTGSDDTSNPVVCTANQTLSDETAGQVVNGSCTNDAGLTTPAAPVTVKLDKTGPTNVVSTVTSGEAGSNGWYTSDVVVTTTGTESVSGPAVCTPVQTLQDETTGTQAAGSCANQAGLTTAAPSLLVKIDKTAPSVTVTPQGTQVNGWFVSNVVVKTTGSDTVSGPVSCSADQAVTSDTTGTVVTGSCTNQAGLADSAQVTVKRDTVAPGIVGAVVPAAPNGSNGWYVTAPTVSFTCTDATSLVASCTPPATLGESATAQSVVGTAVDNAAWSSSTTVSGLKVDLSDPTVTCGSAPRFVLNQANATVSATVTDAISGPATGSVSAAADTSTAGVKTVSLTGADVAGRTTTVACSYTVGYAFVGFFQPINDPAGSNMSTFKLGSTVPVKFALADAAGVRISDAAAQALADSCSARVSFVFNPAVPEAVDEPISSNPANTGNCFRYDAANDQFVFNWGTKGQKIGTYLVSATVLSGANAVTSHSVTVGLR